MKRHEIQVLKPAGVSVREIAELAGVSPSTVKRIAKESAVDSAADRNLIAAHGVGRPSKTDEYRDFVAGILGDDPELPTVEILHRARLAGYRWGKSAFYDLVAEVRSRATSPMVRFEGLPGEFSQHDFGEVELRYLDGRRERLRFFASRLKYSRWSEVRLVPDERIESLVRALLSSFEAWEGIPLVAVFDNPKTVLLRREDSKIEWNRTFGQVALDYPSRPSCARHGEPIRRALWRTSSAGSKAVSSRSVASRIARTSSAARCVASRGQPRAAVPCDGRGPG